MFFSKWFQYMPPGSYAITPDGKAIFLEEVSEELKQRFLQDLKKKNEEEQKYSTAMETVPNSV